MPDRSIDPYKLIGEPSTWGSFGEGENDLAADHERRLLATYFGKRLAKMARKGREGPDDVASLMTGASVALTGLMIASAGGPNNLADDAFESWIAIATFAWHQSLDIMDQGAGHA